MIVAKNTTHMTHTNTLSFPDLRTYKSAKNRPQIDAAEASNPSQSPYSRLRLF
jgi:hypothetical protein